MTTNEGIQADLQRLSAEARAQYEKLQAQRAQIKSTIGTKTGAARAKLQADLDRIESEITSRLAHHSIA